MKRFITISLILFSGISSVCLAKGPRQYLDIYDFSKGLDSYHSGLSIPDGYVQNANNVFFDSVAPVTKRQGYSVTWSTKSYSYTGLWTYTDATNTTWQLARSSDQITANNLGGTTVLVATVSANNVVGEANAFGNAFFVDQGQGVYYWNGTSTTYVTASPKGSIISQFHNRLWVSGLAVPNGNQLYGSAYYAASSSANWTTGPLDTDSVQYSIGLNDNFDNITAEYVYLDTLYLFKHYVVFALYGFGQSSFQISQLTQECGCIDGNSIQTFNGGLKFVSLRGVEDFDGYHCKRISDAVKNKVDPAIQAGGFSQNSWIQNSQSDFQSGTSSPTVDISFTISPGDVVLSSGIFVDTSSSDFNSGSGTNIDTTSIPGSIRLATNNSGTVTDPSFEQGSGSSFSSNWTQALSFWTRDTQDFSTSCTINPTNGSQLAGDNGSNSEWSLQALDTNFNVVASVSPPNNDNCTWQSVTLTPTATQQGQRVYFRFHSKTPSSNRNLTTASTYIWGGPITFDSNLNHVTSCGCSEWDVDNIQLGSSTITTGSFTSRVFDTTVQNSSLIPSVNWTVNTATPAFVLQQSSTSSGPWSDVIASTGVPTNLTKEFVRYIATFTITSADSGLTTIDDVTYVPSSATFYSQSHSLGNISSFGNLLVTDVLNGGTISFNVCTSANSSMSPKICSATTANSQITVATNTFVNLSALFSTTLATQTPTLNDFTIQWFTGKNPVPMSSTVWDNRYWLSLTTNTADTSNDGVIVLSSRGSWSSLDIKAGAFTQTRGNLYHADSSSTGNIYLDNQGYADNGKPINAFIQTKDYSFSALPADDYLYVLYPSADNTGNCSMTSSYTPDRSTSTYSLGTINLSEYANISSVRLPFPVDSSHQVFGESMNFTIGTNDSSCAWNFYGMEGIYKERPKQ